MRIIDSHFHWWPRSVFEQALQRTSYPRVERNTNGGYDLCRNAGVTGRSRQGAEWFDLDAQFAHMATLGHEVDVICSIGPFSLYFSEVPVEEGRSLAMRWNEEMASAQRRHAGRLWASAALPLQDTQVALEVLEHAVGLGLMGVNIPGSVGPHENIDAPRLEPLYDRIEALGLPIFMHPTDAQFPDILEGYNGALYSSLGRVIDVSVSTYRLVLSGIMERHPDLKIVMSHTGGALPYQAGRMDKNSKRANLPKTPTTYLKRMYTDTVSPHALGVRFALEFYGVDHVMYGTDYPCWSPAECLSVLEQVGLSAQDRQKVMYDNARRFFNLDKY